LNSLAFPGQDENGRTALHWACSRGRMVIVTNLINANADPNLARRLPATQSLALLTPAINP